MGATSIYKLLVEQLKAEIQTVRLKATLAANVQFLALYRKIEKAIAEQKGQEDWCSKFVTQLAKDLRSEFPDMKGTSLRNLSCMRDFALAYPQFLQPSSGIRNDKLKLQDPLTKLGEAETMQMPHGQITWDHYITLLDQINDYALRGINKPIGISEYELTEKNSALLKGKLPTIEEIENELKDINQTD